MYGRTQSAIVGFVGLVATLAVSACASDSPGAPSNPPAVPVAPSIASAPRATVAVVGATATLSVVAAGTAPFTFQWKRNGQDIPSATQSSLAIEPVTKADTNATYVVTVTNAVGAATSAPVTLNVQWAPEFRGVTQALVVNEWDSATLAVTVDARPVAQLQWQRDGVSIAGATSASYRVEDARLASDGSRYRVVATNAAGTATSVDATLAVRRPVPTAFSWRGFNFSSFGTSYWENVTETEDALQFAKASGANLIVLDWTVEFNDDGTMLPDGGRVHERWPNIERVINRAKALGMNVALKPHVILPDGRGQNRYSGNTDANKFLPATFFELPRL